MFEDKRGYASVLTDEWFQSVCDRRRVSFSPIKALFAQTVYHVDRLLYFGVCQSFLRQCVDQPRCRFFHLHEVPWLS